MKLFPRPKIALAKDPLYMFYSRQSAMPPSSPLLPPSPNPENFSLVPPEEPPKPLSPDDPKPKALVEDL